MKRNVMSRLVSGLVCAASAIGIASSATADSLPTGYVPYIPPLIIVPLLAKPVMASCDLATGAGSGGWLVERDVRITSYQGWSVDNITFRYSANVTGTYKFRIVIRETDRFGDTITRSELKSVALTAGTPANVTTYFGNVYMGKAVDLSFSHEELAGPSSLFFLPTAATSCAHTALTDTRGSLPSSGEIGFTLRGEATHLLTEVIEYNLPASNKYFVTGRADEKATLDAMPTVFVRTGNKFSVPAKKSYGNVFDVYRFFAPAPGAQSHVFVDQQDHDLIASLPNTGLVDEGADFGSIKPDNSGTCPTWAPTKVYRAFHNTAAVGQRNHRYSTNLTTHNAMISQGWTNEGVVFCGYQ
jgi:Repeat of unknown function (DUF5648)